MVDISKCTGHDCPVKEKCYRYTAKDSLVWQSYGTFQYKNGCDYFWSENIKDNEDEVMV